MALAARPIVGSAAVPLAPVVSARRPAGPKVSLGCQDLAVQSILATSKQLDIAMLLMDSELPWSHTHQPLLVAALSLRGAQRRGLSAHERRAHGPV
jgi:hypothetical protein